MVLVDKSEYRVVHVPVLGATRHIKKIKFYGFSIRRNLADHAWPVSCVTKMGQHQTVLVHVKHGDWIVGGIALHLMHQRIAARSHAKRYLHLSACSSSKIL